MNDVMLLILSLAISFAATAAAGPFVLRWLRKQKAGQSIREEGPESHKSKAGTPTMGGIMFLFGIVVSCIAVSIPVNRGLSADMSILIATLLLYALIGFFDDFVKVVKHRNLGLTARQKLIFQIVIGAAIAVYQAKISEHGTSIYVPVVKEYFNLGILYIPFVIFVLVAMVNAVNLNDGLDGLAGGCAGIVALFLAVTALDFGTQDTIIYTAATAGGCAGFLIYNHYPAKVFMGDTGSLALGGALSAAAIMMHIELILVIAGLVFVLEALSVIIQVVSFQTRGKRIFRMTPIHHHFELGGWSGKKEGGWREVQVDALFWGTTAVCCVIAWFIM